MQWDKGYSSSYYMMEVDPISWLDIERIEIFGGSISRSLDGLRHSANVNCREYPQGQERYVRIYLDTRQEENGEHVPLFTGLAVSPSRDIKGTWYENTVQCYSVLKAADDVILNKGWYAPVELSCLTVLKQLLAPVPAPVEFAENVPELKTAIVAENGETNLSMIERILYAINWQLRISGDGSIYIGPYSKESIIVLDPLEFDVIETEISVSADWYSCPNVFMATNNELTAIARDESNDSPLSIQNRGREVWMYESGSVLNENESMSEYAMRRLKEEQQYSVTASYDRRFIPELMPGDILTMHYPSCDLDGDFMVASQGIDLSHSARTSEEIIGV